MPKNDDGAPGHQDWRTPHGLFSRLDARYRFDLDAAASEGNALCTRYWTEADDALSQPWKGRVFCNPPYKRIAPWTRKAAAEYRAGRAELVVMLLPSSTEALWLYEARNAGALMIPIPRRLNFHGHVSTGTAPFGSMLLTWGEGVSVSARICDQCDEVFVARRGSRTCSGRCRKAKSRAAN